MKDERLFLDDPLKVYLAEVKNVPPLSPEEEMECIQHVRAGDERAEAARKRLLEANLHLVVTIAEHYPSGHLYLLDLIQEGNSGLMTAIQTVRENSTNNFPTYATPFIEHAIAKAVAAPPVEMIPPHLM